MSNTPSMINKAKSIATSTPKNSAISPLPESSLNKSISQPSTPSPNDMAAKMQTAGNSVPSTPKPTQEACAKAIREAEDLVSALECVGGMFGIPSENIIADDTLDNIKVQGDMILAPTVPATGHGNAIMKSIAAVLDYISQRIDSKLNTYQNTNINNGMILDHVAANADPSKGKVIGRYVTPEDDEIIVYDSGIVSAPNTPSAYAMVTDLRNRGAIPQVNIQLKPRLGALTVGLGSFPFATGH